MEHIAALVQKIKASPRFKNTVIVVSSDHLAMKNSAWDQLNKQDRSNLFFVLRGDKPQQEVIATKRNSMDNGATVLDILGGDNFIGTGRSTLSGQSLSEVFLNMKEKILARKPDIIRLWNFPKEMKDFTIDQDKKTIAFSGSHFRLPLLLRVSDNRVEPLPESEYWRRCASSWRSLPRVITLSGSISATKWASSGRRRWRCRRTGASLRGSLAGSKPCST